MTIASQIYNRFKDAGAPLREGDVVILDSSEYHYYQVCTAANGIISHANCFHI